MAKNYETGHVKNVENFIRLQECITSFGTRYAPGDARLKLPNVETIKQNSLDAISAVNMAIPPYLQAISRRENAFTGIPQLASRVLLLAETLNIDKATTNAVKELVRKLYGRRATPKRNTETPTEGENTPIQEHKNISVSQLSFDQRISHFNQIIILLDAETAYQPAETDLSIAGLTTRLTEMQTSNNLVTQTSIPPVTARSTRNTVLYTPITGLVDVAMSIKKYIRAAFGPDSGEYKRVKELKFTKIKV
ncbi:MAG: hypothetical protein LBD91_07665 [Prevotellaceae bacterium]|jgi:hypothetical protein|nr:hypothetical protein [Prevotellaceae bacterium]